MPWGNAWDPARDVSAIGFVFGTEGSAKCGFLIEEHEEMRCQPRKDCVDEEMGVAEKERLA